MERIIQSIYSNEFIAILQEISGEAYRQHVLEQNDEITRQEICKNIEDKLKKFGMALNEISVTDVSSSDDIKEMGITFEIRNLPAVKITLKPQTKKSE